MDLILRVAVAAPLYRSFDYLAPKTVVREQLTPGMRIELPFAKGRRYGVLIEIDDKSEIAPSRLRRAIRCLDDAVLPAELLALCRWAADYYHHPLGEVLAAAQPTLLRHGQAVASAHPEQWRLSAAGHSCDPATLQRAPHQRRLLSRFQAAGGLLTRAQLREYEFAWQPVIKALIGKGLLQSVQVSQSPATPPARAAICLNAEQQAAADAIQRQLDRFQTFLLEGVTGSGKTEVYFEIMQPVLERQGQCLLLVPEIGLTPQLTQRLRQRFACPIVAYHSGLSAGERARAWQDSASGQARIILGTRSAVFLPLAQPGLIIVDEEHDLSFKQQDGFRYHARDVAIRRAQQLAIPIVLGSATPSLESSENARSGRYQWLHLPQRGGVSKPPTIRVVDMRRQALTGALSAALIADLRATVAGGQQALLFVNRRGYAPVLLCHDCGWIAKCPRCDANLTVHQAKRCLRCHHCGAQRPLDPRCLDCESTQLTTLGFGTEQIEDTLKSLFPYQRLVRIDRDTTQRKGAMSELLSQVEEGRGDILIGTQMVAKGHHLPNVTLAAILNADQGLFANDFRAIEHLAQLIVQVAGRAGRGDKAGQVIIQTHYPDHPLLQTLIKEGYRHFSQRLLDERRAAAFPPFSHMAVLHAEAIDERAPEQFLLAIKARAEDLGGSTVTLLGPIVAPMARRAGRHRAQLLLQADDRRALHRLLSCWVPDLPNHPLARKVRWSIDVDPVDLT